MGYYIDFIFEPSENLNCEAVVHKFVKLGARRIPDEDIGPAADKVVHVLFPDLGHPIRVNRKESEQRKGNWAYTRMSWAEDPESVMEDLRYIIKLADRIGCRLYDGQIGEYLTTANLDTMRSRFAKSAGIVIGLIGKATR